MIEIEVRSGRDPLGRRCIVIQITKPDDQFWFTLLPAHIETFIAQILAVSRDIE